MTPISLIVAALMVYSVIGSDDDNGQCSAVPGSIENTCSKLDCWWCPSTPRQAEFTCGLRRVIVSYRNSRHRFADDDIVDDYSDDDSDLDKILGGSYVTYGEIPWMAHIYKNGMHQCGGAIIAEYWVLSVAHCLEEDLRLQYKVVLGDHVSDRVDSAEVTFSVEKIILHEYYESTGVLFDIALIKVAPTEDGRGIRFTNHVQPICLPDYQSHLEDETYLTVSGWGRYDLKTNLSSTILKKAIMPTINLINCRKFFGDLIGTNMICAMIKKSPTKTCFGDSGGPATTKIRAITYLQGLVSFGKCWKPGYPTVFTRVPMYRHWIEDNIKRNKPASQNYIPRRPNKILPPPLPDDSDYIITIVPYNESSDER